MVMETEEFPNLLFASWRSRKSSGMIESKSKGYWRSGGRGNGVNPSLSGKAGEPGVPRSEDRRRWTSQLRQREFVLHIFVLCRSSTNWMLLTQH